MKIILHLQVEAMRVIDMDWGSPQDFEPKIKE